MHLVPQGMCPVEGRQAWRGFVPLSRGGSRMVPLCHVLLMAQGSENLPQGTQGKAGAGLTAKQALAPLPRPLASRAQK